MSKSLFFALVSFLIGTTAFASDEFRKYVSYVDVTCTFAKSAPLRIFDNGRGGTVVFSGEKTLNGLNAIEGVSYTSGVELELQAQNLSIHLTGVDIGMLFYRNETYSNARTEIYVFDAKTGKSRTGACLGIISFNDSDAHQYPDSY